MALEKVSLARARASLSVWGSDGVQGGGAHRRRPWKRRRVRGHEDREEGAAAAAHPTTTTATSSGCCARRKRGTCVCAYEDYIVVPTPNQLLVISMHMCRSSKAVFFIHVQRVLSSLSNIVSTYVQSKLVVWSDSGKVWSNSGRVKMHVTRKQLNFISSSTTASKF